MAEAPLAAGTNLTDSLKVEVVYSPSARQVQHVSVHLPIGCTLSEALPQLAKVFDISVNVLLALEVGIWGIRCNSDQILTPGDRIEFYRPLRVDPKVARRERFVRQGAKTAGLFAKRRPGAKAGY